MLILISVAGLEACTQHDPARRKDVAPATLTIIDAGLFANPWSR
jgi:hypothetical protein